MAISTRSAASQLLGQPASLRPTTFTPILGRGSQTFRPPKPTARLWPRMHVSMPSRRLRLSPRLSPPPFTPMPTTPVPTHGPGSRTCSGAGAKAAPPFLLSRTSTLLAVMRWAAITPRLGRRIPCSSTHCDHEPVTTSAGDYDLGCSGFVRSHLAAVDEQGLQGVPYRATLIVQAAICDADTPRADISAGIQADPLAVRHPGGEDRQVGVDEHKLVPRQR